MNSEPVLPDVVALRIGRDGAALICRRALVAFCTLAFLCWWVQHGKFDAHAMLWKTPDGHAAVTMLICMTMVNGIQLKVGASTTVPFVMCCSTINIIFVATYMLMSNIPFPHMLSTFGRPLQPLRYIEWAIAKPLIILLCSQLCIVETTLDEHLQEVKTTLSIPPAVKISAGKMVVAHLSMLGFSLLAELWWAGTTRIVLMACAVACFTAIQYGIATHLVLPARGGTPGRLYFNDTLISILRNWLLVTFCIFPATWLLGVAGAISERTEVWTYFYGDVLVKIGVNAAFLALNNHAVEESLDVRHYYIVKQMERFKQQLAEMELQRENDFYGHNSHEARNKLDAMTLALQDMDYSLTNTEQYVVFYQSIRDMGAMLDIASALHQYRTNQIKVHTTSFDLANLLEVLVDTNRVRHTAVERKISITKMVQKHMPLVFTDQNKVAELVSIMLHNAVKYTAENTTVQLLASLGPTSPCSLMDDPTVPLVNNELSHVFTPDNRHMLYFSGSSVSIPQKSNDATLLWLRLAVKDEGPGILLEEYDTLFQPYKQLKSGASRKKRSTGLKLALCHSITVLLGGCIGVNSEPGHGAEFFCFLPVGVGRNDRKRTPLLTPGDMTSGRTKRLLVVDDSDVNRHFLCRLLRKKGFECVEANDGDIALEKLAYDKFDAVLLDNQMPRMCGIDVVAQMRKDGISTLVVGITADVLEIDKKAFLAAGANHVLPKPVPMTVLLTLLDC